MNGTNISVIKPEYVIDAARQMIGGMYGMRVMRAERGERGWRLKYVALDDSYPIAAIERSLTREVGESVHMIDLHYDYDTTSRLLCA